MKTSGRSLFSSSCLNSSVIFPEDTAPASARLISIISSQHAFISENNASIGEVSSSDRGPFSCCCAVAADLLLGS